MTDNRDIKQSTTSEKYNNVLDINADTETMNKQLENHMKEINEKKINEKREDQVKKIIRIDKEILKTLIIEWLSLDDEIKSFRDVIKEKNEEKKQYEGQILELMTTCEQEVILTDKGNIIKNVRTKKGPLTPDLIKTTLTEILKSPDTAETYTNHIMEKRIVKETMALRRKNIETNNKKKNIRKPLIKKDNGRAQK
jgi:hypothetical protein